MKLLIFTIYIISLATTSFAKPETKKLDLTTISKSAPKATPKVEPKADAKPTTDEANTTEDKAPEQEAPVKEGYSKIDLRPFNDVNKPIKNGMTATVKCRSNTGIQYAPTDSGFESCLRQNEIEKTRAAQGRSEEARDNNAQPGQSVDLSFGESN